MDVSECRIALLLPGCDTDDSVRFLNKLAEECSSEQLLFWAGISALQDNLLSRLPQSLQQAEEVLSYYFYYPAECGIFSYADMNELFEFPMISISGYETAIREAVHTGLDSQLTKCLADLKKELLKDPLKYPIKVKHRISSMIVSIVRDLDGMITQQAYDELLNEAYHLYGAAALLNSSSPSLWSFLNAAALISRRKADSMTRLKILLPMSKSITQKIFPFPCWRIASIFLPTTFPCRSKRRQE